MLYYISILIIFLVIGFAGMILFNKITYFQKKRKKLVDYLLYRGWEPEMVYNKAYELSS